jgi:hypothetical protein
MRRRLMPVMDIDLRVCGVCMVSRLGLCSGQGLERPEWVGFGMTVGMCCVALRWVAGRLASQGHTRGTQAWVQLQLQGLLRCLHCLRFCREPYLWQGPGGRGGGKGEGRHWQEKLGSVSVTSKAGSWA